MRSVTAATTALIDGTTESSESSLDASTSSTTNNFHTAKTTNASSTGSSISCAGGRFETARSQSAPNGIPLLPSSCCPPPISSVPTSTTSNHPKSQRTLSTQQPSWFAGLRSRISQLSMPEWLSQLGIGVSSSAAMSKPSANSNDASNSNAANKSINSPIRTKSAAAAVTSKSGKLAAKISTDQSTFTKNGQNSVVKKNSYPALTPLLENTMISGVDYVNESYMFPVDYHFHTLNGGVPPANAAAATATATAGLAQAELAAIIPLENADGGNKCDVDSFAWDWTLDSSLWNTINGEYANDTLVVQHFGPLKNLLNCCQHPGKGHNFQSMSMAHPTWCDKCGDFMWGFLTTAVKCDSCNYTCHARCRALVTLDCKTVDSSLKHSPEDAAAVAVAADVLESATDSAVAITAPVVNLYPDIRLMALRDSDMSSAEHTTKPTVLEAVMKTTTTTTVEEEEEGHEKENAMTTGSVQIHMNFTRPINVVAGQTPPSFVDIVNGSDTATANTIRTITTFFLPRNTVKTVNISSRMTTREMIVILLRKFRVADNPRKFALYEYTATSTNAVAAGDCDNSGGADYTCDNYRYNFQRVPDDAYPLRVVNEWKRNATNGQHKHLVLQENDTGDILWDMFEVPELENFLKILDDEERQYSFRIRQKYDTYRFYLVETLRKRGHFDENEDCSTGEHGITMTTHHSIDNVKNNPSFGNNDNPFKETSLIDMSESHQQQQQLLPDDHREVANIIVPSAPLIYDDSTLYSNTNDNNYNNNSENSIAGGRERNERSAVVNWVGTHNKDNNCEMKSNKIQRKYNSFHL